MKRTEIRNALRHFKTLGMTEISLACTTHELETEYLRIIAGDHLTYGVEIEFVANNATREEIVGMLSCNGIQVAAEGIEDPTLWTLKEDMSCGLELVSPILGGNGDGEFHRFQIKRATQVLRDLGCGISSSCGLHVHIGIGHLSVQQIKDLVVRYANNEGYFDQLQPHGRRGTRNRFCQPVAKKFDIERLEEAETVSDIVHCQASEFNEGRYCKLNLHSFRKHGTVEFRQHCGTLDGDEINNWVSLLKSFLILSNEYTVGDHGFDYILGHDSIAPYFHNRKNAYATVR